MSGARTCRQQNGCLAAWGRYYGKHLDRSLDMAFKHVHVLCDLTPGHRCLTV